jgi:uncharacterized protein (TIGR02996 family)
MRTFELNDGKSNKFWNIDLQGARFVVTFGKAGSKGQTQTKDFADAAQAKKAHDKLVAEKLGKGYVETTAGRPTGPSPLQQSLEQALVENPDDLAAHSAYADYLAELGDPRGELIQVQLALEGPGRPAEQRQQLQKREAELLKQYGRQWLGDLSRFLVGKWSGPDKPYHYQFARGWLDTLRVLPFHEAILAALARAPEARLLRRLEVVYDMRYHPFEFDEHTEGPSQALRAGESDATYETAVLLPPLLESPYLTNLRAFKLGFSDAGEPPQHSTMILTFEGCTAQQVLQLLQKCPRLEELYLNTSLADVERLFAAPQLGHLRVLQYYYGSRYYHHPSPPGEAYPLSALANNAALKRLTTLRLHPGRDEDLPLTELLAVLRSPHLTSLTHLHAHLSAFGDEACQRIVESGVLRRLKVLDLAYGNMTDEGARRLAACPDLKHLEVLNVSRNALTDEGVAALRAAGVPVVADSQHGPEDNEYLYEGDVE